MRVTYIAGGAEHRGGGFDSAHAGEHKYLQNLPHHIRNGFANYGFREVVQSLRCVRRPTAEWEMLGQLDLLQSAKSHPRNFHLPPFNHTYPNQHPPRQPPSISKPETIYFSITVRFRMEPSQFIIPQCTIYLQKHGSKTSREK